MRATQAPGALRFRMLGTVHLSGEDAPLASELAARPKTLALLAFIALESRDGPCSRDTILAHFWPDSNTASARHALRQAIYELRRALGPKLIETLGQYDVALNREELTVDAVELQDALDQGRLDDALELFGGELLPGLHFADAPPEFEVWLDDARARILRRLTDAVHAEQMAAVDVGDTERAIWLGRWMLELDPFHEPGVRQVMALLHASGRGAEAVQHYRRFRHRMAAELELRCAPETEALAGRIATSIGAAMPEPDGPSMEPGAGSGRGPVDEGARKAPPTEGPLAASLSADLVEPRRAEEGGTFFGSVSAVATGAVVLILALVATLAGVAVYRSVSAPDPAAPATVGAPRVQPVMLATRGGSPLVLGPIQSSEDALAGIAVASGLAWVLAGSDVPIGGNVAGRLERQGDGWDLDIVLTRGDGEVRFAAFVPGDLVAVIHQIADAVGAALGVPADARMELLPANEAALRAHIRGEWLMDRGEVHAAAEAFQRATGYDPQFALAYHRLSVAASMAFDATTAKEAEEKALSLQARMPDAEALVVEARRAYRTGDPEQAEALLSSVLAGHPGHPEAAYHSAEVLFHYNPLRGRPLAEARSALEAAGTRVAGQAEVLYHVSQVALLTGDIDAFDRSSATILEAAPAGFRNVQLRALRARVLGSADDWRRELAGLVGARDLAVLSVAHNLAVYLGDVPAALDVLEILTRTDREPGVRARAHAARADLLAAAGRASEVAAELRRAMDIDPLVGASRGAQLLTLGVLPPDDPALRAIAEKIAEGGPRAARTASVWVAVESQLEPWVDPHARALAALALGDPRPARQLAQRLRTDGLADRAGAIILTDITLRLRLMGAAPGSRGEAEGVALDMRGITPEEAALSPFFSRPLARLLEGRAHRDAGRLRQADRWFNSLLEHSIPDLALAAVALGERAHAAEARHDQAALRRHLARLDRLQERADDHYLRWRETQPWALTATQRIPSQPVE